MLLDIAISTFADARTREKACWTSRLDFSPSFVMFNSKKRINNMQEEVAAEGSPGRVDVKSDIRESILAADNSNNDIRFHS